MLKHTMPLYESGVVMIRHFYIRYEAKADINYIYLLYLYSLAEYNTTKNLFDTVSYSSIRTLQKQIEDKFGKGSISPSTLSRLLNDERYGDYFKVDQKRKEIALQNATEGMPCFIMLTNREVEFLLKQKDNLLIKYYLYIKHFCGMGAVGKQDFTAKQFLSFCGYSTTSNAYLSKVSSCNRLLVENGFIRIEQYKDEQGHTRNKYYLL